VRPALAIPLSVLSVIASNVLAGPRVAAPWGFARFLNCPHRTYQGSHHRCLLPRSMGRLADMGGQDKTPRRLTRAPKKAPRAEPHFVMPIAPTPVASLPPAGVENWNDQDWIFEPKIDGYRALMLVRSGAVQILSRKNKDLTRTYPTIAAAAAHISADDALIDGEIAALDSKGRISFQALQHRGSKKGFEIRYISFDLLIRDGKNLMSKPIEERRSECAEVIGNSGLSITVELPGTAAAVMAGAKQFGFEGIVAKRRRSLYIPPKRPTDRSLDWLKWNFLHQQEFVIGGFQQDGPSVYELLVGYYDDKQRLRFASKVKDGFVAHDRRELFRVLQPLIVPECPFIDLPTSKHESSQWGGGVSSADMRKIIWLRPELVVQVGFAQWTDEGRLRHARYVGLRDDKSAEDVRRV